MTVTARTSAAWTRDELQDASAVSRRLRERGVRLDADDVRVLTDLLGRPPWWAEAVLFGILWSEHCSYKSTRHLLSRLPVRAPHVVLGPGEDAGVVALPAPCEDLVLVLAHESHNHPSQVLPVEGAATGVGGIVRDVACMGAEVIGVLDVLRFGDPRAGVAIRDIVRGVVQGVADYGNALGVPNLGGDTVFDGRYDRNVLVNVMACGLAPASGVLRSRVPDGPGPWVFVLVGKPTDESGFGGAAFASEQLSGADDRGAVQLPDPFLKRVLLVAQQDVFARVRSRGIPAGFKDLGAGGVACATSELAAAGGRGAVIELDALHRVPRPLPPEVLLCAETQERFCWVVPEWFAAELCDVYNREFALGTIVPGAAARVIGQVSEERQYVVRWQGETVIDCPVDAITSGRSIHRPARRRAPFAPVADDATARSVTSPRGMPGVTIDDALPRLLRGVELGSREYLYRHYDSEVQGRTWLRPGEADAVVLRAHPARGLGVAFAVGGNPRWCGADPELGARHAVAQAARSVAVTGARPWALTDCLNFGDAEDPEVMGDVEATIDGLAAAARALGGLAAAGEALPYVSGNVSLYNHSGGRSIPPSPIVMCAGVIEAVDRSVSRALARAGDEIVLIGDPPDTLTGSVYASRILGQGHTPPPPLDLEREPRLQELAVESAARGWASAAHGISGGGILVAVVEMLLAGAAERGLGVWLDVRVFGPATACALFSERPGIVFAAAPTAARALLAASAERGLGGWTIGRVTEDARVVVQTDDARIEWGVSSLRVARTRALEDLWNEDVTE